MRVSGQEMFVQASDDNMYQAINEMADKLDRQVRKYKTRIERKARGGKRDAQPLEMEESTDLAMP